LYRNRFCAICNGLVEKDLSFFETYGNFISLLTDFTGTETLLDMVLKEKVYPIHFYNCDVKTGSYYSGVRCSIAVSSCNQVGNWSEYDPDIERACHGYTNFFEGPVSGYRGYFKNIFCYICNGFPVSEIKPGQGTIDLNIVVQPYSEVLRGF